MIAAEYCEVVRSRAVITDAPVVDPHLLIHAFDDRPIVALESTDGRFTVGIGEAAVVEAYGPDRFESIRRQAERVLASVSHHGVRLRMFGGFAFEPTDGRFVLPRWLYEVSSGGARLTLVEGADDDPAEIARERERLLATLGAPPALEAVPCPLSIDRPGDYVGIVRRALERIDVGELEKVVLARRIRFQAGADYRIAPVLAALGRTGGSIRFAFGRSGAFFAGATPELLVARSGAEVRSEALAGSSRPEAAGALLDSKKDRAEHGHVARFIRETLERFCSDVRVGDPAPSRLPHVAHLRTPIVARLDRPVHVLELAAALHPTPAVGGVPRKVACTLIGEVEDGPRGWYAGPIGWFDAEGDGELFVALRSARFDRSQAVLSVGAGIVAGSDPATEAKETEMKAKTVASALGAAP